MKPATKQAETIAIWRLVVAVLLLGAAAWFLYNGAVRWPQIRRQRAEERLAILQPFAGKLDLSVDELPQEPGKSAFDEFLATRPLLPDRVHEILGEPQITQQEELGFTREYYVSQWGYGIVAYRPLEPVFGMSHWTPWYKTEHDIRLQYFLAIVVGIPGVHLLWRRCSDPTRRTRRAAPL
jgi:hypothetical protein